MTVVNPKSISGINSITTGSGSDNLLTIHTSDANNTERLRIDSTGATKIVTGIVTTLTATTGIVTTLTANTTTLLSDVSFTGASYNMTWDKSDNSLIVNDNARVKFGTGKDLHIYHNESNSVIREEGTGNLNLQTTGGNVEILVNTTETAAKFISDGAVELYHNDSKKLETASGGVTVTGTVSATAFSGDGSALTGIANTDVIFPDKISLGDGGSSDGDQICVGVGSDLKIYHANSNTSSYVSHENGSGYLFLQGDAIQLRTRTATDNDIYVNCSQGGAVGLYHNDVKTFETTSDGAKIISNGSSNGLFVYHSNGNEVARLAHGGSGDEGYLSLRDSNSTTVSIAAEVGQTGYISGPSSFYFGTTSAPSSSQRGVKISSATTGNPILLVTSSAHYTGGGYTHYRIIDDHGIVGYINADGDGTASYNSSSDYRLKENVVPITDGIEKLKTLKPYRFNFKTADASKVIQGFYAHEVSEAVPNAVKGTKDEMKSLYYEEGDTIPDGKAVGDFKEYSTTEINPQGLDHAKMVPLLTAALQEAVAKIEVLETRLNNAGIAT